MADKTTREKRKSRLEQIYNVFFGGGAAGKAIKKTKKRKSKIEQQINKDLGK